MLMSLVFFKVKKSIKLTKIVEIEEVKIQIFWETSWVSMKFFGKMELMMALKVRKKQNFTLSSDSIYTSWNILLGLRFGFGLMKLQF